MSTCSEIIKSLKNIKTEELSEAWIEANTKSKTSISNEKIIALDKLINEDLVVQQNPPNINYDLVTEMSANEFMAKINIIFIIMTQLSKQPDSFREHCQKLMDAVFKEHIVQTRKWHDQFKDEDDIAEPQPVVIEIQDKAKELNRDKNLLTYKVNDLKNDALKVTTLKNACINYQKHMLGALKKYSKYKDMSDAEICDLVNHETIIPTNLEELALRKLQITNLMLKKLNSDNNLQTKLQDFKSIFYKTKTTLDERRDSSTTTFFKIVATVFSACLLMPILWKVKGRQFTDNIESTLERANNTIPQIEYDDKNDLRPSVMYGIKV